MKKFLKTCSAVMALSMLCSAMPLSIVSAEDTEEPEVMNAVVTLNGTSAKAEGENVTIDGTKITVTASGSYEFSGALENGQICVNVPDETVDSGTVKLFFNGVTITGVSDAAVYVVNAEKTSINLVAETENFLYDGETYTDTTAVVFAKDDLTIKGDGSLRIEAVTQQGIQCNNDLKITGGKVKVKTETEDGIRAKSSVEIKGGKVDVNAEGDGIKSTKGDVIISGGKVECKAGNDAIQGETSIQISDGKVLANGDRGLRCDEGKISVTGGTILATATDYQVENLETEQKTLLFSLAQELPKDIAVELIGLERDSDEPIFSMMPDKKFSYAMITSPEVANWTGSFALNIGGSFIEEADNFQLKDTVTTMENLKVSIAKDPLRFDVNEDAVVDISDAILLSRFTVEDKEITLTETGKKKADCNQDGRVNGQDVVLVLCFIAQLID